MSIMAGKGDVYGSLFKKSCSATKDMASRDRGENDQPGLKLPPTFVTSTRRNVSFI